MPSSLGPAEILVILVVALIVLGPNRLPEAGRQVGKALGEIRRWSQGMQTEIRSAIEPIIEPGPDPILPPEAPTPPPMVAADDPVTALMSSLPPQAPEVPPISTAPTVPTGDKGEQARPEALSIDPSDPPAGPSALA